MSKLSKAFKSIANIDIFDQQTGQLRDTYSILEDMSRVFPTLTKNQRQYLGELASGKRQINVLESLLSNWQGVEKAVKAATNSTGSAEKENSKYLNSIEGKTKAVESAMQKLASATVDDNLVKWFLDAEKGAINLMTSIGGLTPVVLLLITLFSSKLVPALGSVIKVLKDTTTAMFGAKVAAEGLSKTGIFAIISAGITIISAAVGAWNSYRNSIEEAREASVKLGNSVSKESKDLDSLYSSLKNLSSVQNRTEEQESNLLSLNSQIIEKLGFRKETLSKLTVGTNDYIAALKNQITEEAKANEATLRKSKTDAENALKTNASNGIFEVPLKINYEDVGKDLRNQLAEIFSSLSNASAGKGFDFYVEAIDNSIPSILQYYNSLLLAKKAIEAESDALDHAGKKTEAVNLLQTESYAELLTEIDNNTESVDNYLKSVLNVEINNRRINGTLPTTIKEFSSFRTELVSNYSVLGEYGDEFKALIDSYFPEFSSKVQAASKYTSDYRSKTEELKTSISNLSTELGNMDDAQSSLSKAVEEFNTNGSLSFDTVQSLLSLGGNYLQYLTNENGQLSLNTAGIIQLTEAKKAELLQDLEMARSSEILDARENEKQQLEALRNEHLSGWEQREREIEITQEANDEIIRITDAYGNEIAMVSLLGTTMSDTTDEVEKATEVFAEQSDILDDAQSAYETLSSAIEEYNENGVLSVDTLQSLLSLSPEYLQMFFDQAGALGTAEAATMAHVEALKQAKIEEIAASAAAQILAVSERLVGNTGTAAAGGASTLGNSAATMGNKAATAAPKVANLATRVAELYEAMGGKISIDWANKEIASIVANAQNLVDQISNIGVGSGSGGSGGSGGGNSSSASSQAEAIADAKEKLLNTTIKMIRAKVEDEIEALEEELELEEKLFKAEKKRLEDQIDNYKKVVDAKKKSLKLDKEEKEYNDEIADKNKEISEIQNRLTELEFDTSASAMAEKLKLQEELASKQKDLSESQSDREYDLTNQALDDDYDAYKTDQEAQIELLEQNFEATKEDYKDRIQLLKDYLEEEGTIRTDAMNLIASKTKDFYDQLFEWNAKYGDVTNDILKNTIEQIYGSLPNKPGEAPMPDIIRKPMSIPKPEKFGKPIGSPVTNPGDFGPGDRLYSSNLNSGFVGTGLTGSEEFIKALKNETVINPNIIEKYAAKILPNVIKNARVGEITNTLSGMNMQYDKLIEINVSGSIDSNSIARIESTVNEAFAKLTGALSQRGTVRKANAFAT